MKSRFISPVCVFWASTAICMAERPNIVYIFTDQQTASAMSCAGNTDVQTPHMDRLAKRGVRFVNAYCSAPLSGPSRSAMFTGYMPGETGLMKNGTPMNDSLPATTLGVLLSEAGYECAYAGKWHVHTSICRLYLRLVLLLNLHLDCEHNLHHSTSCGQNLHKKDF